MGSWRVHCIGRGWRRVWLLDDMVKAAAIAGPLGELWDAARKNGVHAFYRDGKAVPGGAHKPDPLASSEVLGVLEKFQVAHGRHA